MTRAAILAVDDDRAVLNALQRDLHQRYGRQYRILGAGSGESALGLCRQLSDRGEAAALFIVDQRMPDMDGISFLQEALPIFPDARKVLLTGYADTEAAINAINSVGLDYYLTKPWQPPTEHLYPVLDGLLEDWMSHEQEPYGGIRVVGAMWSADCHDVKDFLARNSIPYQWLDIERDAEARQLLESVSTGDPVVPALFFPDGSTMTRPTLAAIATATGLHTAAELPFYDVVIAGAGPAGLSAAMIASADGLKVLLIERQAPGGQAGNSPKIENFLGFPSGVSGADLTRRAVAQAKRFGAEILTTRTVSNLRREGPVHFVRLEDGSEISAKMVLISTGAWFRTLDLPGIERWNGAGVYYGAAHTEASNYQDKHVVVIGSANSAAQGMLFLSKYASKVSVLFRGTQPKWSKYLDVAIRATPSIELVPQTELIGIEGDGEITGIRVKDRPTGEERKMPASAVFVFIGQEPQSRFLDGVVERTQEGFILTGMDLLQGNKPPEGWPLDRDPMHLETSVPGVFAAGDVRYGVRQGVTAATGEGNTAVSLFWQYLSTI